MCYRPKFKSETPKFEAEVPAKPADVTGRADPDAVKPEGVNREAERSPAPAA